MEEARGSSRALERVAVQREAEAVVSGISVQCAANLHERAFWIDPRAARAPAAMRTSSPSSGGILGLWGNVAPLSL